MLPSRAARRGRLLYWLAGLAVLGAAGGGWAYYANRTPAARPDVITHTVKKENLNVTVTEKGTLESAENKDVTCRVKAGNKGFASTINWVIDDGSKVKAGQLLMILDDSALQDQFRAQKISVDQAYAAKVKAETDYEIAIKQNESNVALAETAVILAEIELEKYTGLSYDPTLLYLGAVTGGLTTLSESGAYRQELDDLSGQIKLAESDADQTRERVSWADRMVKQKYMSAAQADAERSKLQSSLEKLRSLTAKRNQLMTYDRKQKLTDLKSKLENARRALEQAKLEAQAKEVSAAIDRSTKRSIHAQELEKLKDIDDQIKECRIHAPQDGMVVYYKQESSRFGSTPQGLIEQGAQVKEGQKLLRIPNLDVMQVNTKVHEALVSRIKGDVRVPTRFIDLIQIGQLANPDPFHRLVSQNDELVEALKEKYRSREYTIESQGQRANVRVDAFPSLQLPGRVRTVAAVASQTDSWVSDVKVYQTLVLIEQKVEGLKPDMTAEVTIHVEGVRDALAIPIQAVIGGAELGAAREVFVRTPTGYERKTIQLGLANEKMVEVREGLAEGDEVVLNPKVLLGDAKTKTRDGDNGGGNGNGKNGEGKGGFGDPTKKGGGKGGGGKGPGGPGGMPGGPGGGMPGGGKGGPG